jgi:hypothetical protein
MTKYGSGLDSRQQFFALARPDLLWSPTSPHGSSFQPGGGIRGRIVKLTAPLQLLARLRLCGTLPPRPLHAFMAWCLDTRKTPCLLPLSISITMKVKLSLCLTKNHAMKTYWGSGGIASRVLDLGSRWTWVIGLTPRPLYPQRKSPW